jgi:hypothetical protein
MIMLAGFSSRSFSNKGVVAVVLVVVGVAGNGVLL